MAFLQAANECRIRPLEPTTKAQTIMRITTTTAASLVFMGSLLSTLPARAEDEPTSGKGSIGALLGYGFKDGVDFGFGARGGYTLPANVYLGGTFMYHLGKSLPGGADTSLYYFGIEGGYDLAIHPVVIRPYLGLGRAVASIDMPENRALGITATSGSTGYLGFWPGVMAVYPLGRFFAGLDARFLIVENYSAFSVYATGGILL